jgi:hypothetical protein
MRAQLLRYAGALFLHLALQVLVALGELLELDGVARASLEAVPRSNEIAKLRRFARDLAGTPRIVPDPRLRELYV